MEPSLFRYILRHSKREQGAILATVLVSMVFYYLSLNLPKTIVNEAIEGHSFPEPDSTVTVLDYAIPLPGFLGGGAWQPFDGLTLERIPYLLLLSFAFLALVVINNGFKFQINTAKGRLGERMLRRLRFELFDRIMRFPVPTLRRVKSAEMATMIKDEVEPLGGFIGDAFVTPAMLGGQAITAMAFIMVQSVTLGLAALAVVAVQAWLVPLLRRPVLRLGRQRQLTARELAGRIAETVDGGREIRVSGTADYERAGIAERLGRIFEIRFELYQRKFFAKLVNNFLAQVTPFVFYAVGGYYAIKGDLDIGTLVAVIAAYKDLPSPLKELIDWDQQRQDVQIKYEQVIEQFERGPLPADDAGTPPPRVVEGEIAARGLGHTDEHGVKLLDGISFRAPVAERVALVGPEAGGKHELAQVLAGLLPPTAGSLSIGGVDMARAPAAFVGRRLAFVAAETYLFPRPLYDNLVYGLWHVRDREAAGDEPPRRRRWRLEEARRTGNVPYDAGADWIDYEAAGVTGPEELGQRILAVLEAVELTQDVYGMGLRATVDPARHPGLAERVLAVRAAVAERMAEPENAGLVERFAPDAYNRHATVAENLLFGAPVGKAFGLEGLAENPHMRTVLDKAGLTDELVGIGLDTAATMVELFADLPPGHEFFERYSFIRHEDLPLYKALVARAGREGAGSLPEADRARLIGLAFKLLPGHRLAGLDDDFQARVVAARQVFRAELPAAMAGAVDFFEPGSYTAAAPVLDNILFGRIDQSRADAAGRVLALVGEVIGELELRATIVEAGLDFNVGVGGGRLNAGQRQKVALARALLKRPDLMIVDDATAPLDGASQKRIMENVLGRNEPGGVVWVLHRAAAAAAFGLVLVLDKGRLVEQGAYAELAGGGGALAGLLQGD